MVTSTNLRIVSDNALNRATTLTAASTATPTASYAVTNLKLDRKALVHRSVGTTSSFRIGFPTPEMIGCIGALFTNLSPTATMRTRLTNEAVAINRIPYSEQLDNAAWVKSDVTVTANATTAPDGAVSAEKLLETTTAFVSHTNAMSVSGNGNTQFAVSVFAKAAERPAIYLSIDDGGGVNLRTPQFDLISGAVITNAVGTTGTLTIISATISTVGSGWYRCSVVFSFSAAPTNVRVAIGIKVATTEGISGYTGTATSGVYAWGAQLETGNVVTSYFPTTTISGSRPIGYIDSWQSYAYDSGNALCCPAPAIQLREFTAAQSSVAYAYGGGANAVDWVPPQNAVGVAIDIVDTNNLNGQIDISRLILGPYWSPVINAAYGVTLGYEDSSESRRTGGGDLTGRKGVRSRKLKFDLTKMVEVDRLAATDIMRGNGTFYPMLVSVFPESTNAALERDYMLYCKLSQATETLMSFMDCYDVPMEVIEM